MLFSGVSPVWTGGQRIGSRFVWIATSYTMDVTFFSWMSAQPDNFSGAENCIELIDYSTYKWNDANCDVLNAFICEIDLV